MTIDKVGVDAHAHVFHRQLTLAPGRRYDPATDAPLGTYLAMLDRLGMASGVLVQPSFLGFDNVHLLDCLRASDRLRGVAVVPPAIPPEDLAALAAAGIAGIRFNLIGAALPDFRGAPWQAHLKRLAEAGLHVEIQCHGHDAPALLPPLLDASPAVVLDHFGLPGTGDPGDASVRAILDFRHAPQLLVKISAPYRVLAGDQTIEAMLGAYMDAFGADRLLWGSDWPHTRFETTGDAPASLRTLAHLLGADSRDYRAVTGATAARLYRFS